MRLTLRTRPLFAGARAGFQQDGRYTLAPGMRTVMARGHTLGHMSLLVESAQWRD